MKFKSSGLLALALCAAACGKGNVAISNIAPGAQCPNGGVVINVYGQSPQTVCNGPTSGTSTVLVKNSTLPANDAHCPAGGTQVDSGADNGAGGGTAGDGILQAGEITSTQFICNADYGQRVGDMTAPGGAAGTNFINTSGGNGANGSGGNATEIQIRFNRGSYGGHLKVFKTGAADASFTTPAVTPDLGAAETSVMFTTDTTIADLGTNQPSGVQAGTVFAAWNHFWIASGQDSVPATTVSGFSVAANVTLTIPNGYWYFDRDVVNAGTITPVNSAPDAGWFYVSCEDYVGKTGSKVLARGDDSQSDRGGDGGNVRIWAWATVVNQGLVDVSGGVGTSGGRGGSAEFGSSARLYNTANIVAHGGNALTTGGGNGGGVYLYPGTSGYNSGSLDVSGGSGSANPSGSAGGQGGEVRFGTNDYVGTLRNTGQVISNGGDAAVDCSASAGNCDAGGAGWVYLWDYNDTLVNSGKITARGGASVTGNGGHGGYVDVEVYGDDCTSNGSCYTVPAGNLVLSASIDASGGDGVNGGGDWGSVYIALDTYIQPQGQEIVLYGFNSIRANGGDGTTYGGHANSIYMDQSVGYTSDSWTPWGSLHQVVPGGAVINYADLSATGGKAGAGGQGGNGGYVELMTQSDQSFANASWEVVVNAGNISTYGGSGGDYAGYNNAVYVYGRNGVANTGTITARGTSAAQNASGGNDIYLIADSGSTANAGALDVSGGSTAAATNAGGGGSIYLSGTTVSNSATIKAQGGDAGQADGGYGGNGGYVELTSSQGATSNTVAAPTGINIKGGIAKQNGQYGYVMIDGVSATSSWSF